MADMADDAQQHIETAIEAAMHRARQESPQLKPRGTCHNCGDQLAETAYFCDTDCRDDWQWREKAKWRNGGVL